MSKGWVSIHREIQNHWIWQGKREFSKLEAWIDILLTVNHSDAKVLIKGKLLEVKRGESVHSLDTWAKRWNWNKSKVRRFFKLLQEDKMIVTKNEQKTTRITVCKYDSYQEVRNEDETQTKRKRNANETQTTPNNNDNNINNDNNDNKREKPKRFSPPSQDQVYDYFLEKGLDFEIAKSESEKFVNFYGSKGWLVGRSKMKNWKFAGNNWIKRSQEFKKQDSAKQISKSDKEKEILFKNLNAF